MSKLRHQGDLDTCKACVESGNAPDQSHDGVRGTPLRINYASRVYARLQVSELHARLQEVLQAKADPIVDTHSARSCNLHPTKEPLHSC